MALTNSITQAAAIALIDHIRRTRPDEALPEQLAEPPAEGEDNRAPRVLGAYLRGRIGGLPPRYREVLELTELALLGGLGL